jgi:uncharacterized membrane protein
MARTNLISLALGAFSIGLGIVQLLLPGRFLRWIGIRPRDDREVIVRAIGVRELGAGMPLIAAPEAPVWLWARVIGDAMDAALLTRALRSRDTDRGQVSAALAAAGAIAVVDVAAALIVTRNAQTHGGRGGERDQASPMGSSSDGRTVTAAVSVNRPPNEVYEFWRDFANLPQFMQHVEEVRVSDGGVQSHWKAKGPGGASVEWDAEIVEDQPNRLISWRSLPGSQVANGGNVRFEAAPAGRGTNIRVELDYEPPAGPVGVIVAKLSGEEPGQQVPDDLRRLKQILETGEVVLSEATVGERKVRQRPARPPEPGD